MAIDKWQIPVQPTRALRRDVAAFKNGTEANMRELVKKINDLQEQVSALTNSIDELVSIIRKEVKKPPIRKKELPPPPVPSRTLPKI